jgi:hypothetical protein
MGVRRLTDLRAWQACDVDRRHITEDVRLQVEPLAQAAIEEVTGLITYLQSPQALLNARRVRDRQIARTKDQQPRATRRTEPRTTNRTRNKNKNRNTNNERRALNIEARTTSAL